MANCKEDTIHAYMSMVVYIFFWKFYGNAGKEEVCGTIQQKTEISPTNFVK